MKIGASAASTAAGRPVVILTPAGRLDAAGANPLEAELARHFTAGSHCIVIDFGETGYINSSGLRVLLGSHKEAQRAQGAIKLARLSPRLHGIFEMAGFDQVFEIFDTPQAAVQSF